MAGRIGNQGYSYFSEQSYKNLEKAVNIMTKLESVTKSTTLSNEEQVRLITKYKQQLDELGVKQNANLKSLQRELDVEKEIMETRKKEARIEEQKVEAEKKRNKDRQAQQKRDERVREFERAFQRETSDKNAEEIRQQRELDKRKDDALKKIKDLRLSEAKRKEILEQSTAEYKRQLEANKQINKAQAEAKRVAKAKEDAKQDFKESAVQSIFSTSKQDVQAIKDGTYKWTFATKVFSKAVEQFKNAVKEGIEKNYNSAQATLNRIVANNSNGGAFNWSRGGFSFGGRSYSGYKQINNAITDQLSADDLYNNIGNTDVMEAVAKLTNEGGFGLEEALKKGYQDTVIKYIVPYLDTTSEAFDSLEMLMPRNFKKCGSYQYFSKRPIWRKSIFK